jgi:hypothetical protein
VRPSNASIAFYEQLENERAALCEGVGIRTAAPLTGVNRGTVGNWRCVSALAAWNCTTA